jgi:predicted transcriptional regulator
MAAQDLYWVAAALALDTSGWRLYSSIMEVQLTPEQEQQLAELATHKGQAADALAKAVLGQYLEDEARFTAAVELGETALERGDYLTHEQVGARLEKLFNS